MFFIRTFITLEAQLQIASSSTWRVSSFRQQLLAASLLSWSLTSATSASAINSPAAALFFSLLFCPLPTSLPFFEVMPFTFLENKNIMGSYVQVTKGITCCVPSSDMWQHTIIQLEARGRVIIYKIISLLYIFMHTAVHMYFLL